MSDKPLRPVRDPRATLRAAGGASHAPILAAEDLGALAEALARVDRGGFLAGDLLPLADALDDLASADRAGLDFLAGRGAAGDLAALADGFAPWPEEAFSRRLAGAAEPVPVLRLRAGGAPFLAVHATARARAGDEAAGIATRRLLSAWIWRAEPLTRIVLAARSLVAGTVEADAFDQLLQANLKILAGPLAPDELVQALRGAPTIMAKPGPPGPLGPPLDPRLGPLLDWIRKSPFSAFLAPENQARLHCTLGLGRLYPAVPALPEKSPGPAAIAPGAICGSALPAGGIELVLTGSFGNRAEQGGEWGVLVNGAPAEILSWTPGEIRLRTGALLPGCNPVRWSFTTEADVTGNGVDAACAEWLRRPIVMAEQAVGVELGRGGGLWAQPGSVSVLAPVIEAFATPPAPPGGFLPCAPVELAWRIGAQPCPADHARVLVRLLRGAVEVARGLPFVGAVSVTDPLTADYRLEVTSTDPAGNACGTVMAAVTVPRAPAALTLVLPPDVEAGMPGQATVSIPCNAPGGGLPVKLVSGDPARAGVPAAVTIPAGQRSASFAITAGTRCGEVRIEASAPNHLPAAGAVCVLQQLAIAPGQMLRMEACRAASLTVRVTCLGRLGRLAATLVRPDGQRVSLSLAAGAAPPMGCLAETELRLALPALEDGAHVIELSNGIGQPATAPLTVTPRPAEVASAPGGISSFIGHGSCPPPEQTIRIAVRGHDRVTVTYENPDGDRSQVFTRGGPFCPSETIEFTDVFDRAGTLVIAPERNGVAGAVRRVPVTLGFGQGVFSSVTLFASDPAGQRRSAKLTRAEGPQGMQTATDEGSIAEGQVRSFPLRRCVRTMFFGMREAVKDPASQTGGMIPAYPSALGPYLGHPDAPVQMPAENV